MTSFSPHFPQLSAALLDVVLQNQSAISPTIRKALVDERALLLLSRPIRCLGDAIVLEFFGAFWSILPSGEVSGFFSMEEEVVEFLKKMVPDFDAEERLSK